MFHLIADFQMHLLHSGIMFWKPNRRWGGEHTAIYTVDRLSELVYLIKTGVIQANEDANSLITDMYCLANAVST